MSDPKTKCPNCKQECEEQFFPPEKLGPEWRLDKSDPDHIVAWKSEGRTSVCNPYPLGGTFLICKNCAFYTFYPRKGEVKIEN